MAKKPYFQCLTAIIVLQFLIFANLFRSVGSTTLILLALLGLPLAVIPSRRAATRILEKLILTAFAGYSLVHLLSYFWHGAFGELADPRPSYIDQELRFILFIPVYYLFRRALRPWPFWYGMAAAGIVSGLFALISCFCLPPGDECRVSGPYHPNVFGNCSLIFSFVSLVGLSYFRRQNKALVLLPLSSFLLGISACYLSGARGSWVAIPVLIFIVLWQQGGNMRPTIRWTAMIIIVALLLGGYAVLGNRMRHQPLFDETVAYLQGDYVGRSVGVRCELWLAAWEICRAHPLLGVGPGGFKAEKAELIAEGRRPPDIGSFNGPHNIFLGALVACGPLGLIFLLALLGLPLWKLLPWTGASAEQRAFAHAGLILVVAFFHFGLTAPVFSRNLTISCYLIVLAAGLSQLPQTPNPTDIRTFPHSDTPGRPDGPRS